MPSGLRQIAVPGWNRLLGGYKRIFPPSSLFTLFVASQMLDLGISPMVFQVLRNQPAVTLVGSIFAA